MKRYVNTIKFWIISWIGWAFIRFIALTMKIEFIHRDRLDTIKKKGEAPIYTFWHNRLLMMPLIALGEKVVVIISQHTDGEYISQVLKRFGFESVRGSTTRGGSAALRQIVRKMKDGWHGGITPDGPKGPKYKLKEGVLLLSALTGCPILPAAFNSDKKKILSTWDNFIISYPFSRGVMVIGNPIYIHRKDINNKEIFEVKRKEVEQAMIRVAEEADEWFEN
ncbi:MAG: lysophospholipid acyltransferase family protein [bacterium]